MKCCQNDNNVIIKQSYNKLLVFYIQRNRGGGGGGVRILTVGHKQGWVVSTTFSKTLSTQVLTVVVLRVFSAKQLVLCTN